jgi:RNA polymerase-binding transcription factor DksA
MNLSFGTDRPSNISYPPTDYSFENIEYKDGLCEECGKPINNAEVYICYQCLMSKDTYEI